MNTDVFSHVGPRGSVAVRLQAYFLTALLAGCGVVEERDGAPPGTVNLESVPDAVPRAEPPSRYGNPRSYKVNGERYYTRRTAKGYVERGIASWYGTKFHGRRTSSGEPYDMYAMTAAHRSLPLPTYVRVTNLRNGCAVVVRVNDRGPFHPNRIIDLSYVAARKLGIYGEGTGLVEVVALDPSAPEADDRMPNSGVAAAETTKEGPQTKVREDLQLGQRTNSVNGASPEPPGPPGGHHPVPGIALYLQLGAFSQLDNAERLRSRASELAATPVRISTGERAGAPVYRVRLGPLADVESADRLAERLADAGLDFPHIVVE